MQRSLRCQSSCLADTGGAETSRDIHDRLCLQMTCHTANHLCTVHAVCTLLLVIQ